MADVIRNVVVRVKLEQVKADLQAPDMGPINRELEATKQNVDGLHQKVKETSQGIQEAAQQQTESFQKFRDETNRSAEALSKLASAGGLYAVAMDDALPPSIRLFSAIRGGIEQVSGMTTLFASLGGVLAGPVGVGIAVVTTALTLGAVAWKNYRDAAKDAKLEELDLSGAGGDPAAAFAATTPQLLRDRANRLRIEAIGLPTGRRDLGGAEQAFQKLAEAKALEEQRLQLARERAAELDKQAVLSQQELNTSKSALDVSLRQLEAEKQKRQSIEASLGALSRGEQNRLRNLAQRFGAGEELNRGQLQQLQQLGGNLTAGVVQAEFADRGRGLADEIAKSLGVDRNAAIQTAQNQANTARQALDELLDGRDFEAAIEALRRRREQLQEENDRGIAEVRRSIQELVETFIIIRDAVGLQQEGTL